MVKKKSVILIIALIAIITAIVLVEQKRPEIQPGGNIGDLATDLEFQTSTGEIIKLSDFKGKSVLAVNAWAGWCPFCIDEMPHLQRESNKYDDITVIFVHRTGTESKETAQTYLDAFPETRGIAITDPVVWDPDDKFYRTYFGFGMPVTVFIDKDGLIEDKKVGALTPEEIQQKFEELT